MKFERSKKYFASTMIFLLGAVVGGWLCSDSQPRSVLALQRCDCWRLNEITGLLASAWIQKFPGYVPAVVLETNQSIAIEHPSPEAEQHFVVFPKQDIRNAGELSADDDTSIVDIFAVLTELIRTHELKTYRIWTNGPGVQAVGYLHFHLAGS